MQSKYEMSMIGELNFFLVLQIKQTNDGIFINQSMYVKDLLTKFDLPNCSVAITPMPTATKLDSNPKRKSLDYSSNRGIVVHQ